MRYARYLRMEKLIAASDAASITVRWRYGRRLLEDDTATTPAGHLRNGVLAGLLADAASAGIKLSEREVNYRLKAGGAYRTEAEFRTARAEYGEWTALRTAGFPPVEVPADEADAGPFDPRDADERARDAARSLARHGKDEGQLALFDYFPDDRFDETSTLAELAKYAEEMAVLTERFARRDRERAEYLKRLIDAVNGDMGATWAEADEALGKAA
jgi:hypothetical protein